MNRNERQKDGARKRYRLFVLIWNVGIYGGQVLLLHQTQLRVSK
ncbi:hypothetical protein SAMN05216378_5200 [Paenibacillus catalpae]|uniref:Uncharacterized protein n=1 Tax=Paenibacillus catalpae TaxID=1045775 RepID=A0A1I2GH48_9BACL|nr:hypothetical protein SAMN05216378_5200 [Paenibacillus catalpae]